MVDNQSNRKLITGGVLQKRKTSYLAGVDLPRAENALLQLTNGAS
jgi:hypothetical protein